ncbi:MAG: hypothetical protein Q9225_000948 [Loekoesia sp. 1 TL-2023]
MYGDGVPLGLVGAGFSSTGLSFFWSPDFLCSLRYKARLWKKAFLLVSIFVAGALALTVGSATAVLVIPRDQLWQDTGTTLPYVGDLLVSRYFYEITGLRPGFPTQITLGNIRKEDGAKDSLPAQPHAASVMFQEKLIVDWWNAAPNEASNAPHNRARVGVTGTVAQKVPTDTIEEIEFPTIPFKKYISKKTTTKNSKYPVIGCSVAAAGLRAKVFHGLPDYKFVPFNIDFGSARTISVEDSWLSVSTPVLDTSGPTGNVVVSSIESIIRLAGLKPDASLTDVASATQAWNTNAFTGGGNQTTFLEFLIASIFADRLSCTGSDKAYADTSLPPEHWSLWSYNLANDYNSTLLEGGRALKPPSGEDFTELRVNITIKGYSYMSSGITDYLSIALSTVPLRNTAATIKKGDTSSKKARIRTAGLKMGAQGDHVELIYEDDKDDILHGGPQDAEMVPLKLHEHQRTLSIQEVQEPRHDQEVEARRSHECATSDVFALPDSDDGDGDRGTSGIHEDGGLTDRIPAANDEASMSTLKPMGSQQVRVRSRSSDTVQLLLGDGGGLQLYR